MRFLSKCGAEMEYSRVKVHKKQFFKYSRQLLNFAF